MTAGELSAGQHMWYLGNDGQLALKEVESVRVIIKSGFVNVFTMEGAISGVPLVYCVPPNDCLETSQANSLTMLAGKIIANGIAASTYDNDFGSEAAMHRVAGLG